MLYPWKLTWLQVIQLYDNPKAKNYDVDIKAVFSRTF